MNLLFYATVTNGPGKRLQKVIKGLVPRNMRTENYRTINSLTHRLRRPTHDLAVAVLFAASKQDLLDILSVRDLLEDLRIVLLIPNRQKDTIAKGHTLRPRFLTYADSDFSDVAAVLRKMLENIYNNKMSGKKKRN